MPNTDETNPVWQELVDAAVKHRKDGGIVVIFSREECKNLDDYSRALIDEQLVEEGTSLIDHFSQK